MAEGHDMSAERPTPKDAVQAPKPTHIAGEQAAAQPPIVIEDPKPFEISFERAAQMQESGEWEEMGASVSNLNFPTSPRSRRFRSLSDALSIRKGSRHTVPVNVIERTYSEAGIYSDQEREIADDPTLTAAEKVRALIKLQELKEQLVTSLSRNGFRPAHDKGMKKIIPVEVDKNS